MSHPLLRTGDSGPAVVELQQLLSQAGYPVDPDGDFGPSTDAAVRALQAAKGLAVDGIAGGATWAALEQAAPAPAGPGLPWWKIAGVVGLAGLGAWLLWRR